MNVAASDQTSVKPDTEFNPFLSNDKVSYTSLAFLMASQNDTDIIDGTEVSSCSSFSSPMSTTYSSEPPSPFSMDSSSIASSPMTDDTSHLCFDEDTLASLLEEDANNNDPGFFEEESKTKVQRTSFAHLSPSSVSNVSGSPVDGFDFGLAVSSPSFMCTNFVASSVKSNSPVTSERPDTSRYSCDVHPRAHSIFKRFTCEKFEIIHMWIFCLVCSFLILISPQVQYKLLLAMYIDFLRSLLSTAQNNHRNVNLQKQPQENRPA